MYLDICANTLTYIRVPYSTGTYVVGVYNVLTYLFVSLAASVYMSPPSEGLNPTHLTHPAPPLPLHNSSAASSLLGVWGLWITRPPSEHPLGEEQLVRSDGRQHVLLEGGHRRSHMHESLRCDLGPVIPGRYFPSPCTASQRAASTAVTVGLPSWMPSECRPSCRRGRSPSGGEGSVVMMAVDRGDWAGQ